MPRDFQVNVRLCYSEMKALELLSKASHLSKSEFLRHLLRIESGLRPEQVYPPLEDGKSVPKTGGIPEILREILKELYVHDGMWNALFTLVKMPQERIDRGREIAIESARKRSKEFLLRLAAAGLLESKKDQQIDQRN